MTDLRVGSTDFNPASTLLDGADIAPLLEPFDAIPGLSLSNRFVMAPMTRKFSPGNVPGGDVADYYAKRAPSLGLIVTEGTYVDEYSAGASSRVPVFYGDEPLSGWRTVVDAVHARGGRIIPQLWHLGATRIPGAGPIPDAPVVSPSGIGLSGEQVGEPAGAATIASIVDAFVRAAVTAKEVGFDGIELHGAHGYLLDQFIWEKTNRRTDTYGGSIANRMRISAEIVVAIRERVGADFPISYRFSQWKTGHYDARIANSPDEIEQMLTPLVEAGVSMLHVSTRRYWQPAFDGSARTLAGWTKQVTGLPVIALGSIGVASPFGSNPAEQQPSLSLAPLLDLFERNEFDLVALGRAVLADPQWVAKVASGDLDAIRPYYKGIESVLV
ncbi:NADH:flavin oxidoreductase [Rhodococcus sp. T7]|uniref:NADH:flavin oxidoreductase n=1 Tax=Rhodococcus sp. T7 TaxID=627444 RepID=UPI00135A7EFF|nr:NADH:flavin oxidoreductase [Rhodococcus sp. T7]KAF0957995.1 NADH oxidase [Rhodococcus sp. T7]KAF0960154.1 NADH oxidase [Rhodococcus sp. T7]